MKKKRSVHFIFIASFYVFAVLLSAQSVYYVAPTGGNDDNPGTIDQPWATWQKAFNTAQAGDTVYFRGGTWYPDTGGTVATVVEFDPSDGKGNYGEYGNPIVFSKYPGETPVLDCRYIHPVGSTNNGMLIDDAQYVVFKGLTIRNVYSWYINETTEMYASGIILQDCGTVTLDNMTVHDVGGVGFWLTSTDTLYVTNCDAYNLCDSLDVNSPGGDADGFNISTGSSVLTDSFRIAYISGNRAWNCSDDGMDIAHSKQLRVYNNWVFNNGNYAEGYQGDGTGMKFSFSTIQTTSKRMVHNNLSAFNRDAGFTDLNLYNETFGPRMLYYNNTSYKNYKGFGNADGNWNCAAGSGEVIYVNNLAYDVRGSRPYSSYLATLTACDPQDYVTFTTNSWQFIDDTHWYTEYNPAYDINDGDFILTGSNPVDSITALNQLMGARQPDGSLPEITFMKLADTSDLIDGGTDVGLSFNGDAPDLGCFEYDSNVSVIADNRISLEFQLFQNYPNPFNPITIINYQLPINTDICIKIFDILGREIITLINEVKPAGKHTVQWDGKNAHGKPVSSGIYFYQLKTESGFIQNKKMILVK